MGGGGGQSVMLESPRGGHFVSALSGAHGRSLLGVTVSTVSVQAVSNIDARFFSFIPSDSERSYIVHLQTGKYVCHSGGSLSLVDYPGRYNPTIEFDIYPCDE